MSDNAALDCYQNHRIDDHSKNILDWSRKGGNPIRTHHSLDIKYNKWKWFSVLCVSKHGFSVRFKTDICPAPNLLCFKNLLIGIFGECGALFVETFAAEFVFTFLPGTEICLGTKPHKGISCVFCFEQAWCSFIISNTVKAVWTLSRVPWLLG